MKILIIGKVWPEPQSSAAGKRMKQLIQLLQQRGNVHFACANALTGNEIDFEKLGIETHTITLNDDSFDTFLGQLNPNVVVFDRFLTEEQYAWRVMEVCPNAIRILNTEDLHFLRKTRQQFVKLNDAIPTENSQLDFKNDETMRELASILRSDISLMISEFEMNMLQTMMQVPKEQLYHLPLFAEKKESIQARERNQFLFIGNVLHEPNLDAIRLLRKVIWPQLKERLPEAKLTIVGAYPTQEVLEMHQPTKGVEVINHPKSLDEIYAGVKVSLVPLRFGAGVKGKIIEAMEYGVPFVTTSIGAEGLNLESNFSDCITNDWSLFVEHALKLYSQNSDQKLADEQLEKYHNALIESERFLCFWDDFIPRAIEMRATNFIAMVLQHHSLMSTRYMSKWIMEKNKKP